MLNVRYLTKMAILETGIENYDHLNVDPINYVNPPDKEGFFLEEVKTDERIGSVVYQGRAPLGSSTIEFTYESMPGDEGKPYALIFKGYGATKSVYSRFRKGFVENGMPAVTWKSLRNHRDDLDRQIIDPQELIIDTSHAVADTVNKGFGETQANGVGHSMGGVSVARSAAKRPELFKSVSLVAPAGVSEHKVHSLAGRVIPFVMKELIPSIPQLEFDNERRVLSEEVKHFLFNPVLAISEALNVARADVKQDLRYLGRLGITRTILVFREDNFFPAIEVNSRSNKADLFNRFDIFADPKANHLAPQLQPKAVATHILDMLQNPDDFQFTSPRLRQSA